MVPLKWELKREAEVEGDHPAGHHTGEFCHILGLAQQPHERGGEHIDREQDEAAEEEHNPRPLHVYPQHVVPLRPESLPTQRLEGARHSQLIVSRAHKDARLETNIRIVTRKSDNVI